MPNHNKIAIYPGSFDPITFGHLDIIRRASLLFDTVIVSVARNRQKKPLFDEHEREEMIRRCVSDLPGVEVDSFHGLLVDYARQKGAAAVIRGLRAVSDFEYEFQMALVNRKIDENLITVFLMTHDKYSYLNSTIVKELVSLGGDVGCFVPTHVKERLNEKLRKK
ncbi:pantetheine-phosphate adenylyltransferase [candidate division KSB1 bacterium]|nr:pantetheine-phosphate adenylyltransferase [candidate division KSB1 bacterium]